MENNKEPQGDKKQPYEIPPQGSLGLLALGYKGLYAWREARKKNIEKIQQLKNDGKKS